MPLAPLDLAGLDAVLRVWVRSGRRRPGTIVVRPRDASEEPWRDGVEESSGEHVTVDGGGSIWLGRHWALPAMAGPGAGGAGGFLVGVVKNENPGRDAAFRAVALLQDRFDLPLESLRLLPKVGAAGDPTSVAGWQNAVRALRGGTPPLLRGRRAAVRAALDWLKEEPAMGPGGIEQQDRPAARLDDRSAARGPAPDLDPDVLAALRPHVIDLWAGRLSSGGIFHTDEGDIARIFEEDLPRRLKENGKSGVLPVVLYAHGGLVDEAAGLRIAANQVPWWNANGCYPIQFIWETGLFEEIERLLGRQRAFTRDLTDFSDAIVEQTVRAIGGPGIWGGMKFAAASAFEPGAAGSAVAERLVRFARDNATQVRLHAVGHSAGSIFHAHLIRRLEALDAPPLETLSLLAPAITVGEHLRLVDPLVPGRVKQIRMFTMAKDFERADTVTFAYRKSLLHMIHHALEPKAEEPILGLEESLRANPALARRFGLTGSASGIGEVVWSVTAAKSGAHASQSRSHGGFDNDVATMESVARGILALPDDVALKQPFPPDTEFRAAASPRPLDAIPIPIRPGLAPMPMISQRESGARKAFCVGIDEYPNPINRLRGCVADATEWEGALTRLGFAVNRLHDNDATRGAILDGLKELIAGSRPGDVLAFQYSGHGTHVPDLDGDEMSGEDQAICPVDFEAGQLLIDDDIRAVFDTLPGGIQLTCFMDNCFSYSNTRFAVGKAALAGDESRARFVVLPPEVVFRYKAIRGAGMRALAGGEGRGAGTPEEMRWVAFAACNSDEVAYETRGRGDFSRIAVPLLEAGLTNRQFRDRVIDGLGAQPRQHPKLDCRREAGDLALFALSGASRKPEPAPTSPKPESGQRDAVADLLEATARLLRSP